VEGSEEGEEGERHGCGVCEEEVKEGENWIQCDWCGAWFHQRCGEVSTILFNALSAFDEKKSGGTGLHWYCRVCYGSVKSMVAESKGVRKRQCVMESELGGLKIVGKGEGMIEDLEEVKKSREDDDEGGSMRKDVEETVERAVGKIWKALTTVQVRQEVMEKGMNAVKIELLEERVKGENTEEMARVTAERL